ncbi:MAG: arsenate reductase ArsC [Bacillota bacterium]|nr:arsenate reductase ArsC [Bacillota bacterium]
MQNMRTTGKKIKVVFLCTGNSCRSQMAEGFANHYGADLLEASAGISPQGINPFTIMVMDESGVDISAQTSDPINMNHFNDADLIITLCGDAQENCPLVPGKVEKRHWALPDPAKTAGDQEEVLKAFREVRDSISKLVNELLDELQEGAVR